MMRNRAGWLALIVLAIASLLMIFVVMPRINHDGKPIGEAINAAGDAVKEAVTEGQAPAPEKPAETAETAKAEPQTAAPAPAPASPAAPQAPATSGSAAPGNTAPAAGSAATPDAASADIPTFDVLRVEPDGSAVIAGHATPNSTLEITNGASVVAKVDVGPSGDFAAVLDNPLPPGDHQLVLKATAKDGKVTTSEETATVSVPADKSGKLLAMVTKPGKASRLIAVPEVPGQAASTEQSATPPATSPSESASAGTQAGTQANTAAPAPAPNAAAGSATAAPAQETASAAAAAVAAPNAALAARPATASELQISAVEIEGSKIFIAGVAKSGIRVRGSADGSVVGQSQAGHDGHFVIEGSANLTVGDHRIAVEALGSGGQVLVRVEVPFNRPAGEQVAAVASPAPASPVTAADGGAFDNLRSELSKAFSLLTALYADGKVPNLESMAAARSATAIALQSLSEYRLPSGAPISATDVVGAAARSAATARQALDALPRDVAAVGAAIGDLTRMISEAVGPALAGQFNGEPVVADTSAGGARMIEQAPLTQSERNSVIIRRGDTLWQIARRAYGQGVRYTTIYLANEAQINNPDIIQPGQIFGVPSNYRPDSEELHRERLMHHKG